MSTSYPLTVGGDSYEDHPFEQPDDSERTVLAAVRTWLRPICDARQGQFDWRAILRRAGLREDGIEHFDLVMRALRYVCLRPLDTRCQCAERLARDEAALLQTIALLQATRNQAAVGLLGEWLPQPAVSGLLKMIRWLAIDLLDVGLPIRVRRREVTYMH